MVITSHRSRAKVVRLFKPPLAVTHLDREAPRRLTINKLITHKRYARLRSLFTVAQTADGQHVSITYLLYVKAQSEKPVD